MIRTHNFQCHTSHAFVGSGLSFRLPYRLLVLLSQKAAPKTASTVHVGAPTIFTHPQACSKTLNSTFRLNDVPITTLTGKLFFHLSAYVVTELEGRATFSAECLLRIIVAALEAVFNRCGLWHETHRNTNELINLLGQFVLQLSPRRASALQRIISHQNV